MTFLGSHHEEMMADIVLELDTCLGDDFFFLLSTMEKIASLLMS